MKKYKVIFNSSMDINSFQKKYFNNAFNSNVYLLEKNASNNFLSFISEKPISLIDMVSDADVCEISSENYNYDWVKDPFAQTASNTNISTLKEEEELAELRSDRTLKLKHAEMF